VELQETVVVPLLMKDVLVIALQLSPEGTVEVRVNALVNPCIIPTVMVDVADEPTLIAEGEDAAIVKSGGIPNVNEAVVV
jgi:hypothetical protein